MEDHPSVIRRTPIRRTPLARGTAVLKRTAIKAKHTTRAPGDRVDGTLHAAVINRDKMCIGILGRLLFGSDTVPWHQCRDQWGTEHEPTALLKLTVDHVWRDSERAKGTGAYGDRAPSTEQNLVAACWSLNNNGMTKAMRAMERRYLEWIETKKNQS